jgi:hypothetical protein
LYQDRSGVLHIEPVTGYTPGDIIDYEINKSNSYVMPKITLAKPIRQIVVKSYSYTLGEKGVESTTTDVVSDGNTTGERIEIDNPLIDNENWASMVGGWMYEYLRRRITLDSSWRVDVRLDPLDIVDNTSDGHWNTTRMTEMQFTYNGAFRGTGKGKVIYNGTD